MKFGFVVPWGDATDVGDLAAAAKGRLGWPLCLGAGVGRRRLGLAWTGSGSHFQNPTGHHAHAAISPTSLGAGQPSRHRRSSVDRTRDVVSRARRDKLGLRDLRRRMRPEGPLRVDGRVSRHHVRLVGRPTIRDTAARTTPSSPQSSRLSATPCSNPECRSGVSAHSAATSRCVAHFAGTASFRRSWIPTLRVESVSHTSTRWPRFELRSLRTQTPPTASTSWWKASGPTTPPAPTGTPVPPGGSSRCGARCLSTRQ